MINHELRNGKEHPRVALKAREATEERRAKNFEDYSIRHTELTRLRYFDIVKMLVIDPMHYSLLDT